MKRNHITEDVGDLRKENDCRIAQRPGKKCCMEHSPEQDWY